MSDLLLFTLNAIVIYLVSDRLVRVLERMNPSLAKHRQVLFFVIFLALALVTFSLIRAFVSPPAAT